MNNKKPFSKRHPKLYFLFSILFFLVLLAIALVALYYIFIGLKHGISKAVEWLTTLSSKLDAVVIVALITGSVSLVSVIISSIVSKTLEYRKSRREYLAKKREEPYGDFVDMYFKVSNQKKESYTQDEMIKDISHFSRQLTLYGSKPVVRNWIKFRKNGADSSKAEDNVFVMEKIMNSMRKDLGVKKLKEGELLSLNINDIDEVIKKRKNKK